MSRDVKIGIFITVVVLFTTFVFYFWQMFRTANLQVEKPASFALLIPKGAGFQKVMDTLNKHEVINDQVSFRFLARLMKYTENVKGGRYVIPANTNNYDLISKARAGNQDPVKLTFNNIRFKSELISKVGSQFEFGASGLAKALNDSVITAGFGFDTTTIMSMFLPNTYEFYWNVNLEGFLGRMHEEYQKYWTNARKAKATAAGLTPLQVSILASIVEEEQSGRPDERRRVAGLYMNRLNRNILLQADPTVRFALGDFSVRRILTGHLRMKSPYNTYLVSGLPPGPIRLADLASMDAVLNYEKHDFIYMCAKSDMSGYHDFTSNYQEHLRNARAYQAALNKLNILK